jgi:3-oxoacyl-(acyl-carrier-protein) synthase/acyl carrier protein/NAD(P)-dependent dehydrogenase (short-subunit alcohol dehydrogenase family)
MANKNLDLKSVRLSDLKENKEDKIESISKRDIAIIGITGKFPSAENVDEFWENLRAGRDCVSEFPAYRRADVDKILMKRGIEQRDIQYYEGAYFKDVDKFDYSFFRISPKEAGLMDPNHRIFLEEVWKTVEAAGYGGGKLAGSRTGIYLGYSSDFGESYANIIRESEPSATDLALPGNIKSIIASRIAYLMDLKGPSITVDTACSSSLTAVHLACQGIRNGECELAIAGGIKVNLMPVRGLEEGLGIEATEGRAKTFDDSSDGTGFGEGVAVVFLKPLKKAIEDNDYIHAVIKGSAVNQDGASVGITAPNSAAQQDVIVRAWKDAGINPETISFIEAHGTGTKLGDPIEVEGISLAFEKYTKRKQFCAVGSVKSNMGHPDHAAGILGLAKAVMSIRHREIPPTLHFRYPNRKIDFTGSPVYVNDRLVQWKDAMHPMRCGISSFGLSGTNCHMILEEYVRDKKALQKASEIKEDNKKYIIAISARNESSLMNLVQNYIGLMESETQIHMELEDICYTADTGRGHYNFRLAFIVNSKQDFLDKLLLLSKKGPGSTSENDVYYGSHRVVVSNEQKKSPGDVTAKDVRELSEAANEKLKHLETEEYDDILRGICTIYIRGGRIDWERLYKGQKPGKVILPVYPFERKRCWVEDDKQANTYKAEMSRILHPLLERRLVESMEADIFETVYTVDKHWVLNEHRVAGSCVVPGTTYLELAREIGRQYFNDSFIELENILFISPLIVDDNEEKRVQTIVKVKNDFLEFEVASREKETGSWIKHAEGIIRRNTVTDRTASRSISEITRRLGSANEIDYSDIRTDGVDGGPRFKNMQRIYLGKNEALAYLELPEKYSDDLKYYLLHPALMDSAVNMANHSIGNGLYLPLSFKKISIWGTTPSGIYSFLQKKSPDIDDPETASFDISILEGSGKVLVKIEGFTVKKVHEAELKKMAGSANSYYKIGWKPGNMQIGGVLERVGTSLVFKGSGGLSEELIEKLCLIDNKVIQVQMGDSFRKVDDRSYIIGKDEADYNLLFGELKDTKLSSIFHLASMACGNETESVNELKEGMDRGIYSIFYMVRAMASNRKNEDIDIYLISDMVTEVSSDDENINPQGAALFGLGKVIAEEYPKLRVRCIDTDDNVTADDVIAEFQAKETFFHIAYRKGTRYVEEFGKVDISEAASENVKIRENGVYIITGGLGGLGLEVGKFISNQSKVQLCLINRSGMPDERNWDSILAKPDNEKLSNKIKVIRQIEASGSGVHIYSSDISHKDEMKLILADIRKKYGKIDGVFHCAGIAGDGFLIRKDKAVFDNVLSPKVYGTWALDSLTRDDRPDFFILFSSISSIFGAEGQGDYTAGNAYLDSYAAYRNKKGMRTLSINWPQWKETGMAVDFGVADDGLFKSITNRKANQVLEELLGYRGSSIIPGELNLDVIALSGKALPFSITPEIKKSIEQLQVRHQKKEEKKDGNLKHEVALGDSDNAGSTDVARKIASAWSEVLGVKEVDINDNFYDLGGDSIRATRLLKEIEKDFKGVIDISDIFTYPTISEMTDYISSKIARKSKTIQKVTNDVNNGNYIDDILVSIARGEISADDAEKLIEMGEEK